MNKSLNITNYKHLKFLKHYDMQIFSRKCPNKENIHEEEKNLIKQARLVI